MDLGSSDDAFDPQVNWHRRALLAEQRARDYLALATAWKEQYGKVKAALVASVSASEKRGAA